MPDTTMPAAGTTTEAQWAIVQRFVDLAPAATVGISRTTTGGRSSRQEREQLCQTFVDDVSMAQLTELLGIAVGEGDDENVELAARAFKFLLESPSVGAKLLSDPAFESTVVLGLTHPAETVRRTSMRLVNDHLLPLRSATFSTSSSSSSAIDTPLLVAVENLIGDEDGSISTAAIQCTQTFLRNPISCPSDTRVKSLRRLSDLHLRLSEQPNPAEASTVQMRVLELVCEVASKSEELTDDCLASGALLPLFEVLDTDDILLQLNAIHLLPAVGAWPSGLKKLEQAGVVDKLAGLAGADEDVMADDMLGSEALRALAPLCAHALAASSLSMEGGKEGKPEGGVDSVPLLVLRTLSALRASLEQGVAEGLDSERTLTSVGALGAFAAAQPPWSLVLLVKERMTLVREWLHVASASSTQARTAVLHSVAVAMSAGSVVADEEDSFGRDAAAAAADGQVGSSLPSDTFEVFEPTSRVVLDDTTVREPTNGTKESRTKSAEYTKVLFGELGLALGAPSQAEAVSRVCQLARLPFQETYVAAFAVLRMVAAQDSEWGLRALFSTPDFLSLMTDGSLALSNLGTQWRFGVMDAVARNPNRHILHTAGVWNIVKRYVKAGPFRAVAPTPEAAVHGDGMSL